MAKKEESSVAVAEENGLSRYIRETRGELRKVTWPTREEAWRLTAIVLAVTAAFAVFLWAVDALFANALRLVIETALGL